MNSFSTLKSMKTNKEPIYLTFNSLLIGKPPWAKYVGSGISGSLLLDESGNSRHASITNITTRTSTGNGASVPLSVCGGTVTGKIIFPVGSIPIRYTICCLERATTISQGRVLCGYANDNYNFGIYRGQIGTVYDGAKEGSSLVSVPINNWLSVCAIRGTTVAIPYNMRINDMPTGTNYLLNTLPGRLGINSWNGGDSTEFELAHVIIWDRSLSRQELALVSGAFKTYLATNVLQ
jgi:hypothetical protein